MPKSRRHIISRSTKSGNGKGVRLIEQLTGQQKKIFQQSCFFMDMKKRCFIRFLSQARMCWKTRSAFDQHPTPLQNFWIFSNALIKHNLSATPGPGSVEFTLNAIFPFLASAATNKGISYLPRLILILLLFKLGAFFISENPKHMYYSTLLGRADQFLIGMLAAISYQYCKDKKILKSFFWKPLTALLVWGTVGIMAARSSYQLPLQQDPFWIVWPSIKACVWATFIVTYLCSDTGLPRIASKGMELMGEVSYSWYLTHALILWLWIKLIGPIQISDSFAPDFLLNLLVVGCLSLAFAKLSFHTLEEPFLELRKRYVSQPGKLDTK